PIHLRPVRRVKPHPLDRPAPPPVRVVRAGPGEPSGPTARPAVSLCHSGVRLRGLRHLRVFPPPPPETLLRERHCKHWTEHFITGSATWEWKSAPSAGQVAGHLSPRGPNSC